jgi:hypothetical protein
VESISLCIFCIITLYGVSATVSCETHTSTDDDIRICGVELCRLHQTQFKETDNKTAKLSDIRQTRSLCNTVMLRFAQTPRKSGAQNWFIPTTPLGAVISITHYIRVLKFVVRGQWTCLISF